MFTDNSLSMVHFSSGSNMLFTAFVISISGVNYQWGTYAPTSGSSTFDRGMPTYLVYLMSILDMPQGEIS